MAVCSCSFAKFNSFGKKRALFRTFPGLTDCACASTKKTDARLKIFAFVTHIFLINNIS
jgi:hypothetical protein